MSEKVFVFGEELEIEICPLCKGTGNMFRWNRINMKHEEDDDYPCELCKGARFIVRAKPAQRHKVLQENKPENPSWAD